MRRIVYDRGMTRVRYEDCRLPVAAILSNLKKSYAVSRFIKIEEENDNLYFEISALKYIDNDYFDVFRKIYDLKDIDYSSSTASFGARNNKTIMSFMHSFTVPNYKKINRSFIKSAKGLEKYSL